MKDFSFVTGSHPSYIESLYNDYINAPETVATEWKQFFEGFDFAYSKISANGGPGAGVSTEELAKEFAVYNLIIAYRRRGHLYADVNPLKPLNEKEREIPLSEFGLTEADLNKEFFSATFLNMSKTKLSAIIARLKELYTNKIGIQYTYINNKEKYEWVEKNYQSIMDKKFNLDERKRILSKLNKGVIFEKFLNTKFIGQKRFGLEGGESTIPAMDALINVAAANGVEEVVIGMAHRGRLNILANILGKTYEQIFSEFEGNMPPDMTMGSGDVKYHLGFRANIVTPGDKTINVQLTPNPSHLEVVDPVVAGFARAKADVLYDKNYPKVLPILIHGDAAVAGQGVIYELLQMSRLKGYDVGGTVHFVINNQIGFTTDYDDARSADYCTSIAAMVHAPVLHVNGDDPEAVVKASILAMEYRSRFHEDVFIDMICYRKHGHNEGDEPKFTQPQMYAIIDKHPNPREIYTQYLLNNGEADAQNMAKQMEQEYWNELQERLDEHKQNPFPYKYQEPELWWRQLRKAKPEDFIKSPDTAISAGLFETLFNKIMAIPEGFTPLRKIQKLLQDKVKLYESEHKVDWATGELLAYASLLSEKHDVRISGEDVKRGTFSHRHAVIYDEKTNQPYNRLYDMGIEQGNFSIYNSLLSEFAVLGFEYGYAMANPNNLVIWEAQYGDFANGAQTVIDQYIVSAEQKWTTMNGLVMLLPHGYEGGGPEHSSARLERFLQMCAEYNIVVTNITTSANFFHALRRQLAWDFRKSMINFSPKANLRHIRSYSSVGEFTKGSFKEVIDDESIKTASKVKRVVLCSGKVYFDITEKQLADNKTDVAVVRLEQIYPLPTEQLKALKDKYKKAEWVWVQEEPANMGARPFLSQNLEDFPIRYISRPAAASTATGYAKQHVKEQAELVEKALTL